MKERMWSGFTKNYNDYSRFSFPPAIRGKKKLQIAFEEKRIMGS
jgi:hypothetical protein